ncbi:MAG: hypothetical protein ABIZ04_21670 [Opitutus sp.]
MSRPLNEATEPTPVQAGLSPADDAVQLFVVELAAWSVKHGYGEHYGELSLPIRDLIRGLWRQGMLDTLRANFRGDIGTAVYARIYATISGTEYSTESDPKNAASRAAVSKATCRILQGFGLPIQHPGNARAGRKASNKQTEHANTGTT